jgi:hypothetical protein
MDPTATWKRLLQNLETKSWQLVYDNCTALYAWLRSGGFAPAHVPATIALAMVSALMDEMEEHYVQLGIEVDRPA